MAQIDVLFDQMLASGASDLHLHEGQPPKLRLHGAVEPIKGFPALDRDSIRAMLEEICLPRERWDRFERRGDMDFAYAYADKARFRANYKRHYHGYGAVFRTIPSRIRTLEELECPKILHTFGQMSSGLTLVTGPTGSGKSTTLAAVINSINNTQRKVILTIEEPIEFVHPQLQSTVIQREVGIDATSFGEGLRGASRQDVDVVLVGEMRDLETIALAVTAAEMGVLVFGTLHTNSATKTVDRIIDVFPSNEQGAVRESLSIALRAVCAQLLLRRKDKPGRIASHEVMIQTRAIQNMIREGKTNQLVQVIMSNKAIGMQLMDDVIFEYVQRGVVDGHEAYMKAVDKERFKQWAPMGE